MKQKLFIISLCVLLVLSMTACTEDLMPDPFVSSSSAETESKSDADLSETESEQEQTSSVVKKDDAETEESKPVEEEPQNTYPAVEAQGKLKEYDSIVTVGNAGYELYTYVPKKAEIYTGLLNEAAEKMSDKTDVYSMIVPISSGITFPDNFAEEINNSDMEESLDLLSSKLSDKIIGIPLYDALMQHRDEYIYFRTDHHWTARGAYYAYVEFCKTKGFEPNELSAYEQRDFTGFLGSFYKDCNEAKELGDTPDTVEVFYPIGENIKLNFTDKNGNSYDWPMICNVEKSPASLKYSTFAGADNPYTVIENPDITDGSSLAVVKESYANALIPFLSDHYQTIYVLDYRYWDGELVSFVKKNQVQDVLFVNNISMTRSDYLIGKLSQVLS